MIEPFGYNNKFSFFRTWQMWSTSIIWTHFMSPWEFEFSRFYC